MQTKNPPSINDYGATLSVEETARLLGIGRNLAERRVTTGVSSALRLDRKLSAARPFARIRQVKGWSTDWAAALLSVSPTYLRRLERGAVPLSLPLAERMAGVYGVSLNALVMEPR